VLGTEPVFYVSDVRDAHLDFDDMMAAASMSAWGNKPLLKHANIRERVLVMARSFFKLAAKGLNSAPFGNIIMKAFDDLEARLRYYRE
jgi:hypothetical protein